jgi:hypothetical protein
MRTSVLLLTGVVALVAGCLGSATNDAVEPSQAADGPLPNFKPLEDTAAQDIPATLEAAPLWKQGEWWKVRLTDQFESKSYEATRVVVGQEDEFYLVGMPSDAFSDDLMVIHLPGFGQISKEDLSWDTHNKPFNPVQFPLTQGATWDFQFEGQTAMHAKVASIIGTVAQIEYTGGYSGAATYDAAMHEIVKLQMNGYASYEVLDHGYNYTGMVTVPHMFKLVFQEFRTGPILKGTAPATITDTVVVDSTFDRVSFGEIFAGLCSPVAGLCPVPQPNAAGYYEEKATGPGGKTFTLTILPTDPSVRVRTFAMDQPGGTWTFQHTVGGAAILGSEGIAYHTYDVMMPSGEIMASTGEHKHGGTTGAQ